MKTFLFILVCSISLGCSTTQHLEQSAEKDKALEELVAQKKLQIIANWALLMPSMGLNMLANNGLLPIGSNASAIDLLGNYNHLKIDGDSISVYLPFYGERHVSNGYNSNNNIEFDGKINAYKMTYNERKQHYRIDIDANKSTESFSFVITLYENWSSDISVMSNHRNSIRYRGKVLKPEEGKTKTAISNN